MSGTDNQLHDMSSLLKAPQSEVLVLFFFPGAQRSAQHARCTQEVHNFERDAALHAALNTRVVGVSADSVQRLQQDFPALKHVLLLSDETAQIANVFGTRNAGGTFADRATYIVANGTIMHAFKDVENEVPQHSEQVLSYIRQCIYNS
eukprot:14148-Heterococcus_DN1.PRE.5